MLACYTVKYKNTIIIRLFGLPSPGTAASRHRCQHARERGRKQGTCHDGHMSVPKPKSRKKLVLDVFLVVDYDSDLKK